MESEPKKNAGFPSEGSNVQPVAVIDIGATSIRMAIAEIHPDQQIRPLEKLAQGVSLGKDTFTRGFIGKSTMEQCVSALRSYRKLLREYQITQADQIRVVATSAVREASNQLAFIDRVYSGTGLEVEPLDEAEVTRTTFLGVEPYLKSAPELENCYSIIAEVGGGNTSVLIARNTEMVYSQSYRLGSLRLREMLETHHAPQSRIRSIMETHIQRTVEQVVQHVPTDNSRKLMAMGGDIRFACRHLVPEWDQQEMAKLPLKDLESFTDRILKASPDALVRKFHLTFPEAETLGPALLANVKLAQALQMEEVLVTNVNLRDGLLKEMATQRKWTENLTRQIIRSAIEVARKFQVNESHAKHVAELSRKLFHALREEHLLDDRYAIILYLAALLHEVGLFVSQNSFHKHTLYLIRNSEIFGLGETELLLVALVARYHRRASPKPTHEGFVNLDREKRVAISKLAALLRVADALDRSRSQRIEDLECRRDGRILTISVPHVEDLSLEQIALEQKGTLFEEIFGMEVLLRKGRR